MALAKPAILRRLLRAFLDDRSGLLEGHPVEAGSVLDVVLAGERITFIPAADGNELQVPVSFGGVMAAAVPTVRGLQDQVASPPGIVPDGRGATRRRPSA